MRNRLPPLATPTLDDVERWLHQLYIAADEAQLRSEDRRKARELTAMLEEVARAMRRVSRRDPFVLVDAAAGKSYVGLLAAKLLLEPDGRAASVTTLERDERRVTSSHLALERLRTSVPVDCRAADVGDSAAWPDRPSVVVALHACGPAADAIIEAGIARSARILLLVPCCTSRAVAAAARAASHAARWGVPPHAPVRRRFIQAMVDAERTLRLEAWGYETEVVELVGATVTPHNLLWRAHLVGDPQRMAEAARRLAALHAV